MKYRYQITESIKEKLFRLGTRREAIELIEPEPALVQEIRQKALLQSALYSAKIEGNPLTESEVFGGRKRHNLEVQQLLKAYELVIREPVIINLKVIKRWHKVSMLGLDESPGGFRTEQTAVFNQAGVAVYVPPPASEVTERLRRLCDWLELNQDPAPVRAAVAHFWFEKIHPFFDGNGRTGRLLAAAVLRSEGDGFKGMLAVERVIEGRREEYYRWLNQPGTEVTGWIEFFLECLLEATEKLFKQIKQPREAGAAVNLRPRQREIYLILQDHPEVSFDFIKRRFLAVPTSTLHYEVNQLIKKGLVTKLGTTRGVLYRVRISPGL